MTFNENIRLDTGRVRTGGGRGAGGGRGGGPSGGAIGGGIGGLILVLLMMFFGINPSQVPIPTDTGGGMNTSRIEPAGNANRELIDHCETGADANEDIWCRLVAGENSMQQFWTAEFTRYSKNWQEPTLTLFQGQTQSQCGTASNQVGPFYCPLDTGLYIDADFFQILEQQFGSSAGPLAQLYVLAHEFGHSVQDQLGLLGQAQRDPQGPESGGVRIELMADCLAGIWVNHASSQTQESTGETWLKPPTEDEIRDALAAAAAVGDDNIQERTQGRVSPENWSHGSSEARQRWFLQGYSTGDLNKCDTFAVDSVN
ncbi:MAG: neutral zinc metallopeptidase [Actinomycetia bacterium]|nr:neutral zinc metallopeptidase [Actinomycetes bacterium]